MILKVASLGFSLPCDDKNRVALESVTKDIFLEFLNLLRLHRRKALLFGVDLRGSERILIGLYSIEFEQIFRLLYELLIDQFFQLD